MCGVDLTRPLNRFFVVLDKEANVAIAKNGNNLSKNKGGFIEESFRRASMALKNKKEKGGSKIYRENNNRQRIFLGAFGISGFGEDREKFFCQKINFFRSHFIEMSSLCQNETLWENFVFIEKDALAAIRAISTPEGKIEFLLQNDWEK